MPLDKFTFCQCILLFSKSSFWKLFDHSNVQSLFSLITRQFDESILKDIHSRRFYRHVSACVLILSSRLEWTSWNKNWQSMKVLSCRKIRSCTSKNITLKHMILHLFLSASFSLKQTFSVRKKCPYSELFSFAFSHIWIVSLRIQAEFGKIQTRITPNMDTFQAVFLT